MKHSLYMCKQIIHFNTRTYAHDMDRRPDIEEQLQRKCSSSSSSSSSKASMDVDPSESSCSSSSSTLDPSVLRERQRQLAIIEKKKKNVFWDIDPPWREQRQMATRRAHAAADAEILAQKKWSDSRTNWATDEWGRLPQISDLSDVRRNSSPGNRAQSDTWWRHYAFMVAYLGDDLLQYADDPRMSVDICIQMELRNSDESGNYRGDASYMIPKASEIAFVSHSGLTSGACKDLLGVALYRGALPRGYSYQSNKPTFYAGQPMVHKKAPSLVTWCENGRLSASGCTDDDIASFRYVMLQLSRLAFAKMVIYAGDVSPQKEMMACLMATKLYQVAGPNTSTYDAGVTSVIAEYAAYTTPRGSVSMYDTGLVGYPSQLEKSTAAAKETARLTTLGSAAYIAELQKRDAAREADAVFVAEFRAQRLADAGPSARFNPFGDIPDRETRERQADVQRRQVEQAQIAKLKQKGR